MDADKYRPPVMVGIGRNLVGIGQYWSVLVGICRYPPPEGAPYCRSNLFYCLNQMNMYR